MSGRNIQRPILVYLAAVVPEEQNPSGIVLAGFACLQQGGRVRGFDPLSLLRYPAASKRLRNPSQTDAPMENFFLCNFLHPNYLFTA